VARAERAWERVMQPEDASLIRDFLGGDPEAAETLGGWIETAASSYRRRLGDDWEDQVGEVHLSLIKLLRRRAFRGESRLKTYVWRVTNNACLSALRARSRWQGLDFDELEETLEDEGLLARPASSGYAVRDLAERILERVAADCRRLWMMLVAGLSYSEMAERVGAQPGTLRVRVYRCRKEAEAIRAELLGEGHDEGDGSEV